MASEVEGKMPHGGTRKYKGRPWPGSWDGNRYVFRFRGRNGKVARAVCEAFHGASPFPQAVVMHMDENARNNTAANLKWGTQKENLNMPKFIAYCRARIGDNSPYSKSFYKRDTP
jgi:hypothetical protein